MNSNEGMAVLAGLGIFIVLMIGIALIIGLIILIITLVGMWKLFEKAGEPGWKAIIPIYNTIVMSQIATGSYKLGVAYLIAAAAQAACNTFAQILTSIATASDSSALAALSIVSLPFSLLSIVGSLAMAVFAGYLHYIFTQSYGKETIWCVLSIFFFPIIGIILAFDKNTVYVGPQKPLKYFE